MTDFYNDFTTTTPSEWLNKVKADLKGKNVEDTLHNFHPIEEINYAFYGLANDDNESHSVPGQADYARGGNFKNNDWTNNVVVPKDAPKNMNSFALKQLMNGATGLSIDLAEFSKEECDIITKDIGFEHIVSTFFYSTQEQHDWLTEKVKLSALNGTTINTSDQNFEPIDNTRNYIVNSIEVQYAGGNIHQEIGYALHKGHEVLFDLINKGLSIDEAAAQIKFRMGIGSNFFFEINKFKAFRALWHTIVQSYQPEHTCSTIPYIEAETGFLNKSLKDPHNNLLRQTTEALSAVLGGINELTIRPYNAWSTDKNIEREQRLGLNLALLLKEEAYLDKVIDPSGGAYILEELLISIKEKSWKTFQKLEKEGNVFLTQDILRIAKKRIQNTEDKTNTHIGINNYFNEDPSATSWKVDVKTAFGAPVILERDCKNEVEL